MPWSFDGLFIKVDLITNNKKMQDIYNGLEEELEEELKDEDDSEEEEDE